MTSEQALGKAREAGLDLVEEQMRETVLGYIQRGGSPTPMDRILATRYGAHAAQCIAEENFGTGVASPCDSR